MLRPLLASLLTGALAASAIAQDITRKVSFDAPAQRGTVLARALTAQMGMMFEISPTLAGEVFTVRVKDVPLSDLMDKIAEAAGGEWRQVGDGYRLERPAERELKEAAAERAARIAAIRAAIARSVADGSAPFDRSAADKLAKETQDQTELELSNQDGRNPNLWKKRELLQRRTPSARMTARVLASLDPAALLDLPDSGRYVFSTSPTRMQRPLGQMALRAAADYLREQTLWAEAVRRLPYKPHEGYEEEASGLPIGFYGINAPKGSVAKVLAVVNRMGRGDAIGVDVIVADDRGRIIARNGTGLSLSDNASRFEELERVDKPQNQGAKIQLSPLSTRIKQGLAVRMRFMDSDEDPAPVEPDLLEILLHPETTDPLATFATDFARSYADSKKANLVACLPDRMVLLAMMVFGNQELGVDGGKRLSEALGEAAFTESPGWVVIRPSAPVTARKERKDRDQLGQLVRAFQMTSEPDIDQLADLAIKFENPFNDEFSGYLLMMVTDMSFVWQVTNWDLLRFYGAYSRPQRLALRQGRQFQIAQLSAAQRGALNKLVFFTQSNLGQSAAEEVAIEMEAAPTVPSQEENFGDLRTESTEALPNGLPPDGLVTLRVDAKQVLSPAKGPRWFQTGFGPEELASMLVMKEHPELTGGDPSSYPDLSLLKMGVREELTFRVLLAPTLTYQDMLVTTRMAAKSYTIDQLPKETREAIAKARKEVEESMRGNSVPPPDQRGGGGVPPPRSR